MRSTLTFSKKLRYILAKHYSLSPDKTAIFPNFLMPILKLSDQRPPGNGEIEKISNATFQQNLCTELDRAAESLKYYSSRT